MAGLIPKIQSYYQRLSIFEQLEGKIQVSLKVGGVHHVDDQVPLFCHLHGHLFGWRGGMEVVCARHVYYFHNLMAQCHAAPGELDGRAGIV